MKSLLLVKDLWKRYGEIVAVAGLNLSIEVGEIRGLLGPNGAGKTTAVKCMVGLLRPDKGIIQIDGIDISSSQEYKALIGYLPEDPALPEYLTISEFLGYIARLRGVKLEEVKERVLQLMKVFDLTRFKDEFIGSLSRGLRQRVAAASVFIHNPRLLILDEPFLGLDPEAQLTLKSLIRRVARSGGGALISTHILELVERLCDTATIIYKGRQVAEGGIDSIKQRSGSIGSLEEAFMRLIHRDEKS